MTKPATLKGVSGQVAQIQSRLGDLERKQKVASVEARCSHSSVTVEINKKNGWISGNAECIFCGKIYCRKAHKYIGWWGMRMIRKSFNSFK